MHPRRSLTAAILMETHLYYSSGTDIRFAQTELKDIEGCIEIDQKSALANIDGIVVQLPRKCAEPVSNIYDFFYPMCKAFLK